eukprot:scaffold39402_cov160-Amphora_coffeaeformis.AAC.1
MNPHAFARNKTAAQASSPSSSSLSSEGSPPLWRESAYRIHQRKLHELKHRLLPSWMSGESYQPSRYAAGIGGNANYHDPCASNGNQITLFAIVWFGVLVGAFWIGGTLLNRYPWFCFTVLWSCCLVTNYMVHRKIQRERNKKKAANRLTDVDARQLMTESRLRDILAQEGLVNHHAR